MNFDKIFKFICESNIRKLAKECGIDKYKTLYEIRKRGFSKSVYKLIELQNYYRFDFNDGYPEKFFKVLQKYRKHRGISFMKLSFKTFIELKNLRNIHKRTTISEVNFIKIVRYYELLATKSNV